MPASKKKGRAVSVVRLARCPGWKGVLASSKSQRLHLMYSQLTPSKVLSLQTASPPFFFYISLLWDWGEPNPKLLSF